MITITYISKDRPSYLKKSVQSLFNQTVKPEHIVITDCSDDQQSMIKMVDELKEESQIPITFIWKPKEELSRSQGRSLGRQLVTTSVVVSTESDILFPPTLIEETLKEFSNSEKIYVQPSNSWEEENGNIIQYKGNTLTGFFQAYRTEDFDNIGGYNPFFKGWGWEDCDFSRRIINYGCRHVILPLFVTHMWHKQTAFQQENNNEKNQQIAMKSFWDNNKKQWKLED